MATLKKLLHQEEEESEETEIEETSVESHTRNLENSFDAPEEGQEEQETPAPAEKFNDHKTLLILQTFIKHNFLIFNKIYNLV